MEPRKLEERQFHDRIRSRLGTGGEALPLSNQKFYAVVGRSVAYARRQVIDRCAGRLVLDYGCGDGDSSIFLARHGARVVGIDLSEVSLRHGRALAVREGVGDRVAFQAMDCEALAFQDNTFDLVLVSGVLHHLDLRRAYAELARVVKPDGVVICSEALGHNPVIQLYRYLTPSLRTAWETQHILRRRDVGQAGEFFVSIDARFFHLTTLAAVPFRGWRGFHSILRMLERVDDVILRVPGLRWHAWQVVFTLAHPRK